MRMVQSATRPGKRLLDEDITEAVKTRLRRNKDVQADRIDVLVVDGIVTLAGTVRHLLERERAVEIVESVRGVRGIVDEFDFKPDSRPDPDIAGDVTQALRETGALPAGQIQVHVARGTVTLSGTLPSWGEKQLSEDAVKRVDGIVGLQDLIRVIPQSARPDGEIRNEIAGRLSANVWIDERRIETTVRDGEVVLTGCVGSLAEKRRAVSLALVSGVRSVDNSRIQVNPWIRDEMQDESAYQIRTQEEIEKAVKDVLRYDPRIPEADISVQVRNGTATLEGVVADLETRRAAVRDVSDVIGVWEVEDRLRVKPAAGCPDDSLAAAIGAALLKDPILAGFEITVSVHRGEARLEGKVDSHFACDRAETVASSVYGVRSVRNELHVVVDGRPETDAALRRDVEEELFWNPLVGSSAISVAVERGVVTLTGRVSALQEKQVATTVAFTVGVRRVVNRIVVDGQAGGNGHDGHGRQEKYETDGALTVAAVESGA